ncbi:hypothetical protein [Paractinoplanes lichenicola]|uniref:Uncharacterized protein n=1 Tax=Paractinoplanes lichenicola TaxID=2802976 RepID=A0ABS1W5T5_9ACTN|nr:hypothetical protein [Actinoplanes lichenicola]MBL7262100.1 hypothetical protein [Actinoplanes lichenicola]
MTTPRNFGSHGAANVQPGVPRPERRAGVHRLLTVVFSAAALLLAIVAVGLSWLSYARSGEALNRAATAVPAQTSAAPTPTAPEVTDPPVPPDETDEPTADPPGADPSIDVPTEYKPAYTGQSLELSIGCNSSIPVDLDEPRVRGAGPDLVYSLACGSNVGTIALDSDAQASEVTSSSIPPDECADRIRTSPLSPEGSAVRQGRVYCVMTSPGPAAESAKMAVVKINAITGDGSVVLRVTAWDIPK